jgi:hypothetical protein
VRLSVEDDEDDESRAEQTLLDSCGPKTVSLSRGTARGPYEAEHKLVSGKWLLQSVRTNLDRQDDGPNRAALKRALDRIFSGKARISS